MASSSSIISLPHILHGASAREQIADTVIRACFGIDTNDRPLFQSAWAVDDAEVSLDVNGRLLQGMDSINKGCFDVVGPMDTHHMLGGVRVDLQDGASTAHLTASAVNQHYRAGQGMLPGAPQLLAGNQYECEVVKDTSGQWRMKTWKIKVIWAQGSWDVLKPEPSK